MAHLKEEILSYLRIQKFLNFLINGYILSQVQITQFQHGLECSGVYLSPFTFWSVTLQPVGANQATIWQMKGDIPSFHMRY